MSVLLGIRVAFAGGRGSVARIVLMTVGVAVGVVLLLFSFTVMPALQGRIDRYAWHRTDAASPATAPDPALWLPVTDRYAGRNVIRVHIAALGERPPVPPGLDRLPGAGEVVVSPALADLFATMPDDQLRNRFPGRIIGTIGADGLVSHEELVGIVGRTPEELRGTVGAYEIRGFEQPGEPLDLSGPLQVLLAMVAVLLVGPIVVFVAMATRIGAVRRELRFAAFRLAGATRWQTGVLAATETAVAALCGAALGLGGFLLARPVIAGNFRLEGTTFPLDDFAAPAWLVALVVAAVPLIAVTTTIVTLHRVQISPLGAGRRVRHRPPRAWRLIPLGAGILGVMSTSNGGELDPKMQAVAVLAPLSILVGLVVGGPWLCVWISRGLALLSRHATALIAARRIASDPYTAFRAVSGVAIAVFVATLIGGAQGGGGSAQRPTVLDPGVVAIQVVGASEAALAPLRSEGAVVARSGPRRTLVVACADLVRVTDLTCPLPAVVNGEPVQALFDPSGFIEPGPDDAKLPAHSLYVPTDGTAAAEERVRTLAAITLPHALTRTSRDYGPVPEPIGAELAEGAFGVLSAGFGFALVFVLLVAACSLTVSVVAGLMERRRPFALLRASGVRIGELRRIAMLETGIPLAVTALAGMFTALFVGFVIAPDEFALPEPLFFLGIGISMLVAFAMCMIVLPLIDVVTRHDSVRFE